MSHIEVKNIFDVLAVFCSCFTKGKERECAMKLSTMHHENITKALKKYDEFIDLVLKDVENTYNFSEEDVVQIQFAVERIVQEYEKGAFSGETLFCLIMYIEQMIGEYSDWQNRDVVFRMEPLNCNHNIFGISFYPYYAPKWIVNKSERNRENTFNARFKYFFMIRECDEAPFRFVVHYWNDTGLLKKTDNKLYLNVAMSPIMDGAIVKGKKEKSVWGDGFKIEEIQNIDEVVKNIERIFDKMLEEEYGLIVFPEGMGSDELVRLIKRKLQVNPSYNAFVFLPSICKDGENQLTILGPGGIQILQKKKVTSFVLRDEAGGYYREKLDYSNQIDILVTREMGIMAFPICAELLEPMYYAKLLEVGRVNTIVCQSFSPGYEAFRETMEKGNASKVCCLWIDSCSVKSISCDGKAPEVMAAVQLPNRVQGGNIWEWKPECRGECCENVCYVGIAIEWEGKKVLVRFEHKLCA